MDELVGLLSFGPLPIIELIWSRCSITIMNWCSTRKAKEKLAQNRIDLLKWSSGSHNNTWVLLVATSFGLWWRWPSRSALIFCYILLAYRLRHSLSPSLQLLRETNFDPDVSSVDLQSLPESKAFAIRRKKLFSHFTHPYLTAILSTASISCADHCVVKRSRISFLTHFKVDNRQGHLQKQRAGWFWAFWRSTWMENEPKLKSKRHQRLGFLTICRAPTRHYHHVVRLQNVCRLTQAYWLNEVVHDWGLAEFE